MNGGRREREKGETERKSGCYHNQDQGAVSMSMQWGWGCWLPAHQPVQFLERHGFTGAAPAMMGDQTHSEWVLEQDIQNSGWGHDEERGGGLALRWAGLGAGTQRGRTSVRVSRSSKDRLGSGQKGQTKWAREGQVKGVSEPASEQQPASSS